MNIHEGKGLLLSVHDTCMLQTEDGKELTCYQEKEEKLNIIYPSYLILHSHTHLNRVV